MSIESTSIEHSSLPTLAGLCLLLSATACEVDDGLGDEHDDAAEEDEPDVEPRIYGGVVTEDADLRAVVEVRTYWGDSTSYCTGTLVTEDVVVTAAHCVCNGIDASSCNDEATVLFSGLGVQDDPATYLDESNPFYHGDVVAHPSYYFFGNTVQNDIAVIQLHFAFGSEAAISMVDPIDVAPIPPTVGQSLELVGYGLSNDACTTGSGTKRKVFMNVASVSGDRFSISDPVEHTCGGDSGGPALDGDGRLRGVLSYKSAAANTPSYYMEAEHFLSFLSQNACDYDELPVSLADACANSLCPCSNGEGDCDSHAECAGDLICVNNVGANYGLPATYDVCEELADPSLHVELVGCDGWSPKFLVDWGHSGGAFDAYDVDRKEGFGSYQAHYDGSASSSQLYWGASDRNDTFRVRVCRQGSCGPFISRSTGTWDCDGGGMDPL